MNKQEALKVLREQKVSGKNQLDNEVLDYLIKRLSKPTQSAFEIKEVKDLKREKVVEETKRNIDFPVYMPLFSIDGHSGINHVMLKGDNIQSLEFMKKSNVKVDIIYIDPPYGTGKSFTYNDKFEDEYGGQKHQAYINFMRSRLELAGEILSDDGTIFISIDDRQQARLKLLCDDIFGEDNFIACLPRRAATSKQHDKFIGNTLDYILVYSRGIKFNGNKELDFNSKSLKDFKFDDNDGRGLYHAKSIFASKNGLTTEKEKDKFLFNGEYFSGIKAKTWSVEYFQKTVDLNMVVKKGDNLYYKCYLDWTRDSEGNLIENKREFSFESFSFTDSKYSNANASAELKKYGLDFDYPKPTQLIMDLIKLVPGWENSIVLDFFAGSGTTGEAVMKLNHLHNSNIKFIIMAKDDLNQKKQVEHIFEDFMYRRIVEAKKSINDASRIFAFEMKAFKPQFATEGIFVGKEVINLFDENKNKIDEAFGIDCSIMPLESEEGRK